LDPAALQLYSEDVLVSMKNNLFVYARQFSFGLRVFFRRLSVKNVRQIAVFIFRRYLLSAPVPFSAVYAVTYKCQCRCVHCSVADYGVPAGELDTAEAMELIDSVAGVGAVKITFFGGEPLVREDLCNLIIYAGRKGLRTSLDTNGLLLDKGMAARLRAAGIGNVNVSLDSADPSVHDSLRMRKGCFDAAVGAIKSCVALDIPCLVSTYASKRSLGDGDMVKLIALARSLGASGVKILFPILSGNWRKNESERLDSEEEKRLLALMDPSYVYLEDALQMVKSRGKGCSAMERNLLYISPTGDVQPCPAIPVSFGNVRRRPLAEIAASMVAHPFFAKYGKCSMCLMNDAGFREKLFAGGAAKLPVDIEALSLSLDKK